MAGEKQGVPEEVEIVETTVIEETGETGIIELDGGIHIADKAYYDERDYARAAELYRELSETLDDPDIVHRAMYMCGESLVKLKRFDEAIDVFSELAKSKRDSYFVEGARRRLQALKERLQLE